MTPPLRIDRLALSSAVLAKLSATGSLRLSAAFMTLWCGWNAPTEDLRRELRGRRFNVVLSQEGS